MPTPADDDEQRALDYMGLKAGAPLAGTPVDRVFIGSCTNGRLGDLRAAAEVVRGKHVAPGVQALVVPGSMRVKAEAEAEGLDRVFADAGFEWRNAGCSMCLGHEPGRRRARRSAWPPRPTATSRAARGGSRARI